MPIDEKGCANGHEKESCKVLVNKFFTYYTHNNLYYREDRNEKEFCDALVIFEDYNLIFQMKSLASKRIENYNTNLEKEGKKGSGGVAQLNKNHAIMQNADAIKFYQKDGDNKNYFNKKFGSKTFYILLMDGMQDWIEDGVEGLCQKIADSGKYKTDEEFVDEFKKYELLLGLKRPENLPQEKLNSEYFIFNSTKQFEKTLKHCSTIKDFVNFLEFKAALMASNNQIVATNDEALLHLFLLGDRRIIIPNDALIIIDESCNLEDQRIKDKFTQEEFSVEMIDRELIDSFSYQQNSSEECNNSELAVRELVSLNRRQRAGLTELILQVLLQKQYLGIFFREDRDTIYCISFYSKIRKEIYRLDTRSYIHNVLYPHLCYKISLQNKSPNKVIFIVYEKHDYMQASIKTLAYIEGLSSDRDIEDGKQIEEIINLNKQNQQAFKKF